MHLRQRLEVDIGEPIGEPPYSVWVTDDLSHCIPVGEYNGRVLADCVVVQDITLHKLTTEKLAELRKEYRGQSDQQRVKHFRQVIKQYCPDLAK